MPAQLGKLDEGRVKIGVEHRQATVRETGKLVQIAADLVDLAEQFAEVGGRDGGLYALSHDGAFQPSRPQIGGGGRIGQTRGGLNA